MTTWINPKAAANLVGIGEQQFRSEWCPEDGPPQVRFRTNGKRGSGRRIEVDYEDLEAVLDARTHSRAG